MVRLNPDKEIVNMVRNALKKSGGFCPCRIGSVPCPCDKFKNLEKGFCNCELYEKI